MSYPEHETEDRRLRILQSLMDREHLTADERQVREKIQDDGHTPSREQLLADVTRLDDMDLLISQSTHGFWLMTLTAHGEDVARGRASVPGVARATRGK